MLSILLIAVLAVSAFATGQCETAPSEQPTVSIWVDQTPSEVPLEETAIWPVFQDVLSADIEWEYTVGEPGQFVDLAGYIHGNEQLPKSCRADYIEALTLNGWGIEGVHYEVDENGMFYMTPEQLEDHQTLTGPGRDRYRMRITGSRHLPYHSSLFLLGNGNVEAPQFDPVIFGAQLERDPLWAEYIDAYDIDAPGEVFEIAQFPSHGWTWNISREDEVGVAYENWDEFRRRWYPRLILANPGEFDSVWEDYLVAIEDDISDDIDLWMERAEFVGNYRKETNNPNANP